MISFRQIWTTEDSLSKKLLINWSRVRVPPKPPISSLLGVGQVSVILEAQRENLGPLGALRLTRLSLNLGRSLSRRHRPMPPLPLLRSVVCAITAVAFSTRAQAAELEPIGPGPFELATTNLEVTPRADVPMFDCLNGKTTSAGTVYLTDILAHPEAVPTLTIAVPGNRRPFGPMAGHSIPLVLLVMYPTAHDNARPEYVFPYKDTGDSRLPHMQRAGEKPIFAAGPGKFPLIVLSGGYNTHAMWHLNQLKSLASHGYVVIDMLHGDGRGPSFECNLALRVLELRATIDYALQSSDFAGAIDPARIGAIGQSAGGHTILAAMGGTDPTGRIPAAADPRIKAGFGLVPFTGRSAGFWPMKLDMWYFGEDRAGLHSVRTPFLAVYGENDVNVPPDGVEAAVRAVSGPAAAVMLEGQTHQLYVASQSDVDTWEILFFDAWLKDDAAARRQLESGTSVRGGVGDHKTIAHGPQG